MQLTAVACSKLLNTGNPFQNSLIEADQILRDSIKKNGILEPVRCFLIQEEYYLFDGHKRVSMAQKLGLTEIATVIYPADSLAEAFQIFAELHTTELSAVGKALLIQHIKSANIWETIPPLIRNKFALPSHKNDIKLLNQLCGFSQNTLRYLETIHCSTSQLRNLLRITSELALSFIEEVALPLNFNANQLRKGMELIADIELAQQKGRETVTHCKTIISDSKNSKEAQLQINLLLEERRRPNFNATLREFETEKKALFKNNIKVDPKNFEGNSISFSFAANSPLEAAEIAAQINSACQTEECESLFRFMHP